MTREEWKARYRAIRVVRGARQSGRAAQRTPGPHADLPHLLQVRTQRVRPAWSPRLRRANAAVSSAMMLLVFALLAAALLSGTGRPVRTPAPILVGAPLAPAAIPASTPI